MIGKSTSFRIARMSTTEFARMPLAPPCLAAKAILDMIKELCNGSSANAWQETINAPLISLFNIDPSNLKAITNTVYLQQLKYATLPNKNKRFT